MSTPLNQDPRLDQAAVTDESLLAAHEKLAGKQPDDGGHYRLMPLVLLFVFSGFIFFAGTYLGHYSGNFSPLVFDEHGQPPKVGGPVAAIDPIEAGRKAYNNAACNTCHLPTGLGTPGAIPPLVESEWVTGSEERAIRIVLYGLTGAIKVKGTDYNGAMPPFGKGVPGSGYNWSDERVAHVLTYIRQEWGNKAAPVTPEKVAEIHAKDGARGPYTAAELEKLP
jgi:mono/diheme cytochrome c family protein